MKTKHIYMTAVALCVATLVSCSTFYAEDIPGIANEARKSEYTKQWIQRFGLFDSDHDWTTLTSVNANITGEYGSDIKARIYNADPLAGGHLIGYSRTPGVLSLDLPKSTEMVFASVADAKGNVMLAGEFEVTDRGIEISSSQVREPSRSRSAHEVSYFDAMVVCEDLGSIGDYDFNDVVLGLKHVAGTNTLKIMPMAAGGTLHIDVWYDDENLGEIHGLLKPESDVKTTLNAQRFEHIGASNSIKVPANFSLSNDWKKLRLVVKGSSDTYTISGPKKENGWAPQMFCIGGDWYWPKENVGVDVAYPGFTDWTTTMLNHDWAFDYSHISKVVPWDLSQFMTNWFSGVTNGGVTYKALIDGTSKVDVKSGEVYFLDPPTSMASMYQGDASLLTLDVAPDHFDTSLVEDMTSTFQGCTGLTELDLNGWDTGNVTTMKQMFSGCKSLTDLNLSGWNTSEVKDISYMFGSCTALKNLDISNWDISNVSDLTTAMFSGCTSLEMLKMNNWLETKNKSNIRSMLATLPNTVRTLMMRDCDFDGTEELGQAERGIFQIPSLNKLTMLDVTGWLTPDLITLKSAFQGCASLEEITGVNSWDVPKVTSLEQTFQGCAALKSLDLSNWNTSNVTTMKSLFSNCPSLESLNLSGLNTSETADVSYMFSGCKSLKSLDISDWDISKVTVTNGMFGSCTSLEAVTMNRWINTPAKTYLRNMLATMPNTIRTLSARECDFTGVEDLSQTNNGIFQLSQLRNLTTLDVTDWKTPDLLTLKSAFEGCSSLEEIIGVNTWKVPNVTSLDHTFSGCTSLMSIDLSKWDTSNVTSMQSLFNACTSLSDINLSGLNTSNTTDVSYMFSGCKSLTSLDISGWDISKVTNTNGIFQTCTSLKTVTMNNWINFSSKSLLRNMLITLPNNVTTLIMRNCDFAGTENLGSGNNGLFKLTNLNNLTTLDVTGWKTPDVTTLANAFDGLSNLEVITGVNTWNVPEVKSLSNTFHGCSALKSLDLSHWDTSNVTTMSNLFSSCTSLADLNLAGLNTSNVTDLSYMFAYCKALKTLDISGWDISKVTNSSSIFTSCESLESVTMNNWKSSSSTSQLKTMVGTLPTTVRTLVMRDCDFTGTENLGSTSQGLFYKRATLTTLDATGWKTPDLTTLISMFDQCTALTDVKGISGWDVSQVKNMSRTFAVCSNLKNIDLSKWDTGSVTTIQNMFAGCNALEDMNLAGWKTSSMTDIGYLFSGCKSLKSLDVSGWDISNVTSGASFVLNCPELETVYMNKWKKSVDNAVLRTIMTTMVSTTTKVKNLEMRECDFTGVTNLGTGTNALFYTANPTLVNLDLTGWKIPNLTTLDYFFNGNTCLENLVGLNSWDVSNVANIYQMFGSCKGLTSIDLSKWNPCKVTNAQNMFTGCSGMTDVNLAGWNTEALTNASYMFNNCSALTEIDLSGWNTSNVTTVAGIFQNCKALRKVNLKGWDLSNCTTYAVMFNGCPSGITIICSAATQAKILEKKVAPANAVWVIVD